MALTTAIEVLLGSTWTDIARDGSSIDRLSIRYGISGNRPTDVVADSGECLFTLRNSSRNSGGLQGYYSPLHANVRANWTFGTRIRVVCRMDAALSVSSITRSGSTATVTTSAGHGMGFLAGFNQHWVTIAGANETEYNGLFLMTATGTTTLTYTVSGTPSSPATGTITAQRSYVKFQGKIDTIDPEPGQYRTQYVHVTAYDYMRDLHEAEVIDVAIQVNESEDTVIEAVLDSLPSTNQPLFRDLDTGLDELRYALHDLGRGATAAAVLSDIAISSYGLCVMRGDGIFRYVNRNTRALVIFFSTYTNTMRELEAPSSLSNVYNRIRVINHPKTIDATDIVLFALTGDPPLIQAGETQYIEGAFRDPDDAARLIGAASTVSLSSGTDYAGNSAVDGSGTDLTADLDLSATTIDATRVVFAVENTGSDDIFLVDGSGNTTLQIRGKGVYDNAPRTFTTTTGNADRPITIDMPYSSDDGTAQQIGTFIADQYADLSEQVDSVTVRALTDTVLRDVLAREPGDVIRVTEAMTGLSSVSVMILGVQFDLGEDNKPVVTWLTGPKIDIQIPNAPTSLTATIESDHSVNLSWSTGSGASGAHTRIYRDGVHIATTAPGTTTLAQSSLTRATTYTWEARHIELSLLSDASNSDTARPIVAATGGTVTTPGDGYKYHTFASNGTFTITTEGRVDYVLVGGGGGGGTGIDNGTEPAGSGGGGGGGVLIETDNPEPAGAFGVVIGAAGAPQANGGDTTYRSETASGGGAGGGFTLGDAGDAGASGGGGAATAGAAGTTSGTGLGNVGGTGFSTGPNNAAGGGGGGGSSTAGSNGTASGGNGGTGVGWFGYASLAAGGKGGRGTGVDGNNGTNPGDGGNGNTGAGNLGGSGAAGLAVFRYPI